MDERANGIESTYMRFSVKLNKDWEKGRPKYKSEVHGLQNLHSLTGYDQMLVVCSGTSKCSLSTEPNYPTNDGNHGGTHLIS